MPVADWRETRKVIRRGVPSGADVMQTAARRVLWISYLVKVARVPFWKPIYSPRHRAGRRRHRGAGPRLSAPRDGAAARHHLTAERFSPPKHGLDRTAKCRLYCVHQTGPLIRR